MDNKYACVSKQYYSCCQDRLKCHIKKCDNESRYWGGIKFIEPSKNLNKTAKAYKEGGGTDGHGYKIYYQYKCYKDDDRYDGNDHNGDLIFSGMGGVDSGDEGYFSFDDRQKMLNNDGFDGF